MSPDTRGIEDRLHELYFGQPCHPECQHHLYDLSDDSEWESILEEFAKQLHSGGISDRQIHQRLYFKTASKLADAITKNFSGNIQYDDPRNALAQRLKQNVYQFSGAKSLTEAAAFSELLTDENGKIKPFSKFRRDVQSLHGLYNEQYLQAEYNNAIAQAQMAEQWTQYNEDDWLHYRTAGDERVRETHAQLDGIVQPKSSSFWKTYYPPNGWGCRCHVVAVDKPRAPLSEKQASDLAKGSVESPVFENNAGLSGVVFTRDHPYFESFRGIRQLDAVKNYGLRPVSKILSRDGLPARLHMDTETDYYAWWSEMVKQHGVSETDFALTDKLGTKILFDATPNGKKATDYFKDHIIRKQADARHEYAANLQAIISDPDEIWTIGNDYQYIKYFSDGMYLVSVVNDNGLVRAETMYRVEEEKTQTEKRRGILLYKK